MKQIMEQAKEYYKVHKDTLEKWEEGNIKKVWIDENGNVCIKYESGKWWHYNNKGEWW